MEAQTLPDKAYKVYHMGWRWETCVSNKQIINVYTGLHGPINTFILSKHHSWKKEFIPTAHILDISYCLSFRDSHTTLFIYNEQGKKLPTNNEYVTVP